MPQPFNRTWIINAPWAHPVWSQYALLLYDLTTPMDDLPPPILYREGDTHEFLLYAMDPDVPVKPGKEPPKDTEMQLLGPANHGYQFKADSDAAAEQRMDEVVEAIEQGVLHPDTDFRKDWDEIFKDAYSLKR
jgi:hypothetical protein